ncbi:MAG: carbohydrate ABC transporter permease [Gluconacetobacter diazotrophicus]|nr:carbohydrate ABC transporter permease [Gluconacetobacter diazotrophicus]
MRPSASRIAGAVLLALLVAVSLLPLWMAAKTALTPNSLLYAHAAELLPREPTLDNVRRVLGLSSQSGSVDFATALRNSLLFTAIVVVAQTFFSALAAYGFARLKFPGRTLLFNLVVAGSMVPTIVLFIPNFVLIKSLGWLNTMPGMVAPFFFMTPFSVFFLRQFFLNTPREVEEAARLAGAGPMTIFLRVVLPMHKGALATLAILTALGMWNEFFWPFLVGTDPSVRVIAVAINVFREQHAGGLVDWTGLLSCAVLSAAPVVLALVLFGRRIVDALQSSAVR